MVRARAVTRRVLAAVGAAVICLVAAGTTTATAQAAGGQLPFPPQVAPSTSQLWLSDTATQVSIPYATYSLSSNAAVFYAIIAGPDVDPAGNGPTVADGLCAGSATGTCTLTGLRPTVYEDTVRIFSLDTPATTLADSAVTGALTADVSVRRNSEPDVARLTPTSGFVSTAEDNAVYVGLNIAAGFDISALAASGQPTPNVSLTVTFRIDSSGPPPIVVTGLTNVVTTSLPPSCRQDLTCWQVIGTATTGSSGIGHVSVAITELYGQVGVYAVPDFVGYHATAAFQTVLEAPVAAITGVVNGRTYTMATLPSIGCTQDGVPGGAAAVTVDTSTMHDLLITCGYVDARITVSDLSLRPLVPADMTVMATSDAGTPVPFAIRSVFPATCDHAAGSLFAMGATVVTCDAGWGASQFTVTVVVAPPVMVAPRQVVAYADGTAGVSVSFVAAASSMGVAVPVACDHATGSVFVLGTTRVTCSAVNPTGDSVTVQFPVVVKLGGVAFRAPLSRGGTIRRGTRLHVQFRLLRADGRTSISNADAMSLLRAGRVTVVWGKAGSSTATAVRVSYDTVLHAFTGSTVVTSSWRRGSTYSVTATARAADGTAVGGRSIRIAVVAG
ncbi:MAG: hypothetical protein QOG52_500 [Frankiaceae bacterium]|nr:hypothetical protein [Frankiaceae bacterium]